VNAKAVKADTTPWPSPRENPDLAGHENAESTLSDAFESGRMHHAWLLCGPRGIGKATLAFRFARYVLSGGGAGEEPAPAAGSLFGDDLPVETGGGLFVSPQNPVFRRAASGGHADLLTVERGLNDQGKPRTVIVVDDVRGVGSFLRLTSAEGGWRVVVIDSADEMNISAANAVLKVLEEPPARALLLLVSHNPGYLLPTIRSRCRRLIVKPLGDGVVSDLLEKYRPDIAPGDAAELARLSEGSIGKALTLAGEGGLDLYRTVIGLLETLPNLNVSDLHDLGTKLARPGADAAFRTVSDLLRWWLGRLIVLAAGGNQPWMAEATAELDLMKRLAGAAPLERWLEVWEKINHLFGRVDTANLDRKQVILNVFLFLEGVARH
jgi:DNA polymerase III subunit delta'